MSRQGLPEGAFEYIIHRAFTCTARLGAMLACSCVRSPRLIRCGTFNFQQTVLRSPCFTDGLPQLLDHSWYTYIETTAVETTLRAKRTGQLGAFSMAEGSVSVRDGDGNHSRLWKVRQFSNRKHAKRQPGATPALLHGLLITPLAVHPDLTDERLALQMSLFDQEDRVSHWTTRCGDQLPVTPLSPWCGATPGPRVSELKHDPMRTAMTQFCGMRSNELVVLPDAARGDGGYYLGQIEDAGALCARLADLKHLRLYTKALQVIYDGELAHEEIWVIRFVRWDWFVPTAQADPSTRSKIDKAVVWCSQVLDGGVYTALSKNAKPAPDIAALLARGQDDEEHYEHTRVQRLLKKVGALAASIDCSKLGQPASIADRPVLRAHQAHEMPEWSNLSLLFYRR